MIEYTRTIEIAINSLHPLDRERTEKLISQLREYPELARKAEFFRASDQIRVLPISTELKLLFEAQNDTIKLLDVTTPRRYEDTRNQQVTAL